MWVTQRNTPLRVNLGMVGTFHVVICPHNRLLYGPETQGSYLGKLVPMGVKDGTPHRTISNTCFLHGMHL